MCWSRMQQQLKTDETHVESILAEDDEYATKDSSEKVRWFENIQFVKKWHDAWSILIRDQCIKKVKGKPLYSQSSVERK